MFGLQNKNPVSWIWLSLRMSKHCPPLQKTASLSQNHTISFPPHPSALLTPSPQGEGFEKAALSSRFPCVNYSITVKLTNEDIHTTFANRQGMMKLETCRIFRKCRPADNKASSKGQISCSLRCLMRDPEQRYAQILS